MSEYRAISIARTGGVATVRMKPLRVSMNLVPYAEIHHEMGRALSELRLDDDIRIVVLTGEEDGEFLVPPPTDNYRSGSQNGRLGSPRGEWERFTGIIRAHQAVAEMEKVVISKVNGDAMGFGQSLMFNSDLVVAREDAKICDMHLALGETMPTHGNEPVGPHYSLVPGDGALSFVSQFMSPPKVKEYFFLSEEYTGAELAATGMINTAVPLAELDAAVDDLIARLLRRSADVLAFTKRVLNRRVVTDMNATLDPAVAYQLFDFRRQ
ncbi:enoyl-CoA hydratase/isomerase family protein [Microcella sp.]|uniref:enoyl-CoA hydratase/isomerase family protein n=1 Tax=Microcella sp. TaxID=1913979 RepID=UPI0025698382|nr:enoyl-CoA hydratase/isomerase family protein [Microcella sp.]MBX9472381.1 enoyl-CoA hydratase/isomerase family protein [Microcella sp.]